MVPTRSGLISMTFKEEDIRFVTGCDAEHPDRRGGQHVAQTCTGVFAIHEPSGLGVMVKCARSQLGNKARAVDLLRMIVKYEYDTVVE